MTEPPDYTAMTGAQFASTVGVDPAKWAEAFVQCARDPALQNGTDAERASFAAGFFRDAMEAAVRGANIAPDGESATLGNHVFPMRDPAGG